MSRITQDGCWSQLFNSKSSCPGLRATHHRSRAVLPTLHLSSAHSHPQRDVSISHFTGEGTEARYAHGTGPRSHSQKGRNHPEFKPRAAHFQTHSKGSFLLSSLFWSCKVIDGPQLEKGMATHSSILTWRIPWIEEPGGLQSVGSQRVGHDWATNTHTHTHTHTHPHTQLREGGGRDRGPAGAYRENRQPAPRVPEIFEFHSLSPGHSADLDPLQSQSLLWEPEGEGRRTRFLSTLSAQHLQSCPRTSEGGGTSSRARDEPHGDGFSWTSLSFPPRVPGHVNNFLPTAWRFAARPQACFRSYKSTLPPPGNQSETRSLNPLKSSSSWIKGLVRARAGLAEAPSPQIRFYPGSREPPDPLEPDSRENPQTRCCWSGALTNWA